MGKSELASIATFECRSVLDSIQNEFDQLQKEDTSLSKLHEELVDLIAQKNVWAKKKSFNEKNCVICCLAFNLLFKRKLLCSNCQLWVCRSCASWDHVSTHWLCNVCEKQKLLDAASSEWIYSRIKAHFGNFNAAKSLQNFLRQRRISDSENDSGYGTTGDYFPLMKFFSSQSLNKDLKMTDCEEEEEGVGDEEELREIQDSIETILEGLLGGVLDDAFIDQLYPNSALYLNLFSEYQPKLIKVIEDLSRALQKALHNLPNENGITPTTAHAALKNVISALVEDCQDIPCLESAIEEDSISYHVQSLNFTHVISSYESLIAAAVINKVVEESQSKFKSCAYTELQHSGKQEIEDYDHVGNEESFNNNVLNSTTFGLPVKCVQIEEIEEIMQEFTDSEDDKLSSISKYSNSIQNIDEIGVSKQSDLDSFINLDYPPGTPIPFPEFGCDLIEENEDGSVSTTSWEENWLFRKRKRLPLYSNFKYQLLTYCDEPPTMFIPYPSESTDAELDVSSELSETYSAGTLDFSSDPEEEDERLNSEDHVLSKSSPKSCQSSPLPSNEVSTCPPFNSCSPEEEDYACKLNDIVKRNSNQRICGLKCKESTSMRIEEFICDNKSSEISEEAAAAERKPPEETPPRPGTIAEREHKKWLNAIPLKNNPYSAENISKRYSYNKKTGYQGEATSFEEFERKRSVSSDIDEPPLNKVNCGPKSINSELYERDYYVNKDPREGLLTLQNSVRLACVSPDNNSLLLSDEALNSFEEKVYVRSGKVFTLENRVRRLEREINDTSLDASTNDPFSSQDNKVFLNRKEVSNQQEVEKVKRSKPCQKVHSLTARSLSREFRNLARLNLPKPMNRTIPLDTESAQSSAHQGDNGQEYTSDESNTSSTSANKLKTGRHISRSILERATYWERRAEQGLLSDASVGEEFPSVDVD